MKAALSRAAMALAARCLGDGRRDWFAAMQAEYEAAAADGEDFSFALGCLVAAVRDMPRGEEGSFALTSYGLALGVMLPMAALQIGCALFGFPYLYPGQGGLPGALLEGRAHEGLLREVYQGAVPSLALLLLLLGLGHLRIAWAMLERDWAGVTRIGLLVLATAVTLVLLMGVLFLDSSQALLQASVLTIELATLALVARWHAQLPAPPGTVRPG